MLAYMLSLAFDYYDQSHDDVVLWCMYLQELQKARGDHEDPWDPARETQCISYHIVTELLKM